ncbi:sperm acrosome membrane-associated protein 6 isoform X2 [Mobula birostris]|uniref:sperm acrosome membrane-associated protein 6 isoform X2 n=1 Tax=Mobula birostris TaxID=1983395 RepID=UPI003B27F84D
MPRLGLPLLCLLLMAAHLCPARTCFLCFTGSSQKFCTEYIGQSLEEQQADSCWLPISELMKSRHLYWMRVVPADFKLLKSTYSRALRFIKRRSRAMPKESYASLLGQVEKYVLNKVYKLKKATACNQTCGINPAATYFDCVRCRMRNCNGIPFSCPIEDVKVNETGHVSMKCQASFNLPKINTVIWRIAKVRSDIIEQFKVLHVGADDTLSINKVKTKNSGTYACDIISKDTILLRRFFHLTVTRTTLQSSKDLQVMFQKVLGEERGSLKPPVAKPLLKEDERLAETDRVPAHSCHCPCHLPLHPWPGGAWPSEMLS